MIFYHSCKQSGQSDVHLQDSLWINHFAFRNFEKIHFSGMFPRKGKISTWKSKKVLFFSISTNYLLMFSASLKNRSTFSLLCCFAYGKVCVYMCVCVCVWEREGERERERKRVLKKKPLLVSLLFWRWVLQWCWRWGRGWKKF